MLSEFCCWISDLLGKRTSSCLSACSWYGWYYHIIKVWNPRGCGHTPKPPARMRNEQQGCFHPFCGTASRDLSVDISGGSMIWQHSRSQRSIRDKKSSLLKLRGDLVTTSASLFQDQFTTKARMSKPRLFTSIPAAADSAETFPYSAGREKVKLFVWFLSCECLDYLGEQNSSLWVSLCHWNHVLRAVQAEDGSNALLPAVGRQNARAMSPWGQTSSCGLSACRVEERGCVLCFCVLSPRFLGTWNWQWGKHSSKVYTYSVRVDQDFWAVRKKHPPLTCFDGASKNSTFPNGQDAFIFIDVLHLEKAKFFWEIEK